MNAPHRFTLEPNKGPSTRHTCPQCGKRREFTRYLDTETGELLPEHVGRCNRADKCGYHYPPRDYIRDNRIRPSEGGGIAQDWRQEPPPRPPYLHQRSEAAALRANPEKNTLSAYWSDRIGAERWDDIACAYALGTWQDGPLAGSAVFWQADALKKVKAGKIMLYDPATGRRRKDVRSTSFVHFERTGRHADDLNVEQCLFGEHLLPRRSDAVVAVVESEKTALIAACLIPEYLWVATGSRDEFGIRKLQALTGRKVLAFPDLSENGIAYTKWKEKAIEIGHLFASIHVMRVLEKDATEADREAGLDIADLLLRSEGQASAPVADQYARAREAEQYARTREVDLPDGSQPPGAEAEVAVSISPPVAILSEAEIALQRLISRNPSVGRLVDSLGLVPVRALQLTTKH